VCESFAPADIALGLSADLTNSNTETDPLDYDAPHLLASNPLALASSDDVTALQHALGKFTQRSLPSSRSEHSPSSSPSPSACTDECTTTCTTQASSSESMVRSAPTQDSDSEKVTVIDGDTDAPGPFSNSGSSVWNRVHPRPSRNSGSSVWDGVHSLPSGDSGSSVSDGQRSRAFRRRFAKCLPTFGRLIPAESPDHFLATILGLTVTCH